MTPEKQPHKRPGRKALFVGARNEQEYSDVSKDDDIKELSSYLQSLCSGDYSNETDPGEFSERMRPIAAGIEILASRIKETGQDRSIEEKEEIIPGMKKEIDQLRREAEGLKTENREIKEKWEKTKNELAESHALAKLHENEIQKTLNRLESLENEKIQLTDELKRIETENRAALSENKDFVQVESRMDTDEMQKIKSEIESLKELSSSKEAELEKSRKTIEELREKNMEYSDREAEVAQLKGRINQLEEELAAGHPGTSEEKETREKEQIRADTIIRENPIPMLIVNPSFTITDVNKSYEKLAGLKKDDLLEMSLRKFTVHNQSGEGLGVVIKEKKQSYGEVTVELPSGVHILEQYGIPLLSEKGDLNDILIVYNDVTNERNEAEEIRKQMTFINELQQRSETIIQENPMPIILVDPSFNVKVTNQAYVEMSGIPKEKLLKMNARDFNIIDQKGEGLKGVIKDKKRSYGEITVKLPSGIHILEQYGIPITDNKNDLTHILIVYNEVTEIREKETEVRTLMEEAQDEATRLAESAEQLAENMIRMSGGDLTAFVLTEEGEPLEELKNNFNASIEAMRDLIVGVSNNIVKVDQTSQELSKSSDEIGKATEQIALETQASTDFTRGLLEKIEENARDVSELSASIEEIAGTSQEVMKQTSDAASEGKKGASIGKEASEKMTHVGMISNESVQEFTQLNERMKEISKIVKLITGIADQTNLLALNAAIEAARAGEHGRGFAVVAGEIRNLAGESKDASKTIEDLITAIQADSQATAASMNSADTEIQSGIESVNSAIEAMNHIVEAIENAAEGVIEITRATEDQATATTRLMQTMEESSMMTKENIQRIEDMAALAQEVSASTQEVGSVAHELNQMAELLRNMMDQFKLN